MNKGLISVIVPIYNVENYLKECIESIISQTYTNIELILVDDGSTDKSGEICDKYAEKDKRIEVIHKKNAGVSAARNTGLESASGEYIAFVDSDDYIDKTMLEVLANLLEMNEADVAMCAFERFSVPKTEKGNMEIKTFDRDELIEFFVKRLGEYYIVNSVWGRLYKAEVIKELRFKEGRINEDILYTAQVLLTVNKAVYTLEKLYHYRDGREGSITGEKESMLSIGDKIYLTGLSAEMLKKSDYEKFSYIHEVMDFLEVSELISGREKEFYKTFPEYRKHIWAAVKGAVLRTDLGVKTKIRIMLAYMFPRFEKKITSLYGKMRTAVNACK